MCWRFLMLSGISPFESWPNNKRVGTWMMIYELDDRNSQSNLAGWISNFSTSSHFCLRMPKQPSRWPRMCGKSISPSAHLDQNFTNFSVGSWLEYAGNVRCNEYNDAIWVFPKIGGTPKWMVKIMENRKTLLKWMIWGYHYFRKHPYVTLFLCGMNIAVTSGIFLSLQVDLRSKAPSWEEVTEDAQDFIRKLLQPFGWMMIQ